MATPTRLFEAATVRGAVAAAFRKLDPRVQVRNPVMFVVLVGSVLVTLRFAVNLATGGGPGGRSFSGQVTLWLWLTVLFANFAEAMAEGRGRAQADALRRTRRDTTARRRRADDATEAVAASRSTWRGSTTRCSRSPGSGCARPSPTGCWTRPTRWS
jgi:K+-transporting ATPase ATPase B chain